MSVELSDNILKNWEVLHGNTRTNIEKSNECDQSLVELISTSRRQREELNKLFGEFNLLPQIKNKLSEIKEQTKTVFNLFDFLQNEILHRIEMQKKEEDFQRWRLSEVNNLRKFENSQKKRFHQYQTKRTKKYNEEFLRLEKLQSDADRLRKLYKLQKEKEAEEAAYRKKMEEERKRQEEIKRKIEEQFLLERLKMEERKKEEKKKLEKVIEERKRKAEERRKKKEEELHIRKIQMSMNLTPMNSPQQKGENITVQSPNPNTPSHDRAILESVIGSSPPTGNQDDETEEERLSRMEKENRLLKERLELLQKLKELEKKGDN